jgi:hypothetical protein
MGCPPSRPTLKHQPFFRNAHTCCGVRSASMNISPEILFQPGGKVNLEGEPASRFPLPTVASLPASLSRARHGPAPCDQGGIPPWIPRRAVPRGKPRDIFPLVNLEGEPASRFPLPTVASLPASLSRAGYGSAPCDQGGIPPWIPRRAVPRGKPRGIFPLVKADMPSADG